MVPLLAPIMLGVFGWYIAHWLGAPILAVETLRREAHEAIYYAANIDQNTPAEIANETMARLRSIAAKLLAMHATSPWLDFATGFKLKAAAIALVGVSNTFGSLEMKLHHHMVLKSLMLPRRLSDDEANAIAAKVMNARK